MTKQSSSLTKGVYTTANGGYLVPLDSAAETDLKNSLPHLADQVTVSNGSVLFFKQQLPQKVILKNHARLNLGKNATLHNCLFDNSDVTLDYGTMENSLVLNSKLFSKTPAINRINNYLIKDSVLLDHLVLNAKELTACESAYARDLALTDTAIDGGVYANLTAKNSTLAQPGSTLVCDSHLINSVLIDPKECNKDWSALSMTPEHFLNDTTLTNAFVFNDNERQTYLEACQIDNAIVTNGATCEKTVIKGPKDPQAKLVLHGLDAKYDNLDLQNSQKSVLVAGRQIWLRKRPNFAHLDYVHDYTQTDIGRDRHFKTANLSPNLVNKLNTLQEPSVTITHGQAEINHDSAYKVTQITDLLAHDLKYGAQKSNDLDLA